MSEKKLPKSRLVTFSATVALLILSLSVSFLVGELVLRLYLKDQIVLFPRYHAAGQYGEFTLRRFRPDTIFWHTSVDGKWKFEINSQGFRNSRNFMYEKTPGVLRILSIGDSHTAGFEVRQEHTYSAVIERILLQNGIPAEVINAGVSGFSTAEEYAFLKHEGIKYKPDIVVLGFFANDFEDNIKAGLFTLKGNSLVIEKKEHIPGVRILGVINEIALNRWLSENSYLYSFALNTVWSFAKQLLRTKSQAKLEREYAIPTERVDNYQESLAVRLFQEIYALCRGLGITLILIDVPHVTHSGEIKSSVPSNLVEIVQDNSDYFIYSKDILLGGKDGSKLHVPHGHRHISEYTHRQYGAEAAQAILNMKDQIPALKDSNLIEQPGPIDRSMN